MGVLVRLIGVPGFARSRETMSKLLPPPAPEEASVQTTWLPDMAGAFCWSVALPEDSRVTVPAGARANAGLRAMAPLSGATGFSQPVSTKVAKDSRAMETA